MRKLQKRIIRLASNYYRDYYREKILFSKPITVGEQDLFEIHMIVCESDWVSALWTLKSFYHYSGTRPKLCLHDDGSLSDKSIAFLKKHLINGRVIRRLDVEHEVQDYLKNNQFCSEFRKKKNFYCALKLFDAFICSESENMLFVDSDVLFFRKPVAVIDCINNKTPFFMSDIKNSYSYPIDVLNNEFDIKMKPMINAGLLYLRKKDYESNLQFMEFYFKKVSEMSYDGLVNRHEQTLNAMIASKVDAMRLDTSYQISMQPITDKTVSHHFVANGTESRANLCRKGLKQLRANKFLIELGAGRVS